MLGLCCHLDPRGSAVCCLLVMEQAESMMGQVIPVQDGQQSGRSWGRQQDKVWPPVRGLRFPVSRFLVCFVLVWVLSV